MKSLLLGIFNVNAGPFNVNQSLVLNSDARMDYLKLGPGFAGKVEKLLKIVRYKNIIVSGKISRSNFSTLLLLKKRIFLIVHGNDRYENAINRFNRSEDELEFEDEQLQHAFKIIAVSEKHAEWLKLRYPQYSAKITFVNNGITISPRPVVSKMKNTIAVSGGNRLIKNNDMVCEAVSLLRKQGHEISVAVFGKYYDNNANLKQYPFARMYGQMQKQPYLEALDQISLFVLNSEFEPFGLVVADALNTHCSLLVSNAVGANSIIKTLPEDIVFNQHDVVELSSKIQKLLESGNADRLLNSIDKERVSEKMAYQNLMNVISNG